MKESVEGAWTSLVHKWDLEMDMKYIPTKTFEVRMESQFRLDPKVESEAAGVETRF